ncbi:hypothetical protein B0H14DRAFT_3755537 [Mycena olivaceomarginata]|nr:hypothetical protein B0H14DRAFT_3755537 [Mycena olivaceomarginata]
MSYHRYQLPLGARAARSSLPFITPYSLLVLLHLFTPYPISALTGSSELPSLPTLPPHLATRCQNDAQPPLPHAACASSRERAPRGPALLARIDEPDVPRALHPLGSRVLPLSPLSPPPHTHHSLKLNTCNTRPRRLCTCGPLTPCTRYRLLIPGTLHNFSSAVRPRVSDVHRTTQLDSRARPACVLPSLLPLPLSIPSCTPSFLSSSTTFLALSRSPSPAALVPTFPLFLRPAARSPLALQCIDPLTPLELTSAISGAPHDERMDSHRARDLLSLPASLLTHLRLLSSLPLLHSTLVPLPFSRSLLARTLLIGYLGVIPFLHDTSRP